MKRNLYRNVLAASVLAVLGASQAYAQDSNEPASPTADENTVQLDAMNVTAQRREEDVQKTPLAISVLGGAQLERMQVSRIEDVKYAVPNIIIEANTGTSSGAKIYIRGVGADESMFTNDPAVALYIDDVYIPRQNGAMFDLYDVERIEVLRGPQGTLYGRNATGGAIRYITRKPRGEKSLKVDTTVGSLGRLDARVSYNTRIGESLDVSAAFMSRNRDGYIHDLSHDRKVNDSKVNAGRLSFALPVGERSYANLSMDYLKESSGAPFATPVQLDANGKLRPVLGSFHNTRTDIDGINDLRQFGVAFSLDSDFDSFSMRNIAHYRGMDHKFLIDVDGTEQTRYHLYQDQKQRQHGYEAQFTSQLDGPFNWVGGIFTFSESNTQPTRNDIFGVGATNDIKQDTTAAALYFQGNYDINERLTLTAGGRYSYENKDFSVVATNANGSHAFTVDHKKSWKRPDWKLMASYDFTDNVMGYVSTTTGFKSGGFNGRATTAATVTMVNAETMRAYEAGIKSSFLGNRIQLNANYYRLDYDGLQMSAVDPNGVFVVTNATGALVQGIELDVQAQLTRQWHINGGLGTVDAKYQNFAEVNRPIFDGRDLKQAPELQWQLSTTYIQPLANADLVFTAQVKHTDSYFQNQDLSRLIMTPSNRDVGARISYEPKSGDWQAALWGKNLTNNKISTGGFDIAGLGIGVIYPSLPRTYGVDFKYRFW